MLEKFYNLTANELVDALEEIKAPKDSRNLAEKHGAKATTEHYQQQLFDKLEWLEEQAL